MLSLQSSPVDNSDEPLQFQGQCWTTMISLVVSVLAVKRGTIKIGDNVEVLKLDGSTQSFRVTKLAGFIGLDK